MTSQPRFPGPPRQTRLFQGALLAPRLSRVLLRLSPPFLLLLLNVLIAGRMFRVEYSANLGSNEGQFIAIARAVAQHLGDLRWWPEWSCGLPFQNTYMPLLPVSAGLWSRVTGVSAALAFHQVSAAFLCLGPVFVYSMALVLSRRPWASFIAAAGYSVFSPCALLRPIGNDLGSVWNLRRLQILAFYGEGSYTACTALLPLAILFLYLALTRGRLLYKVLAGVFMAATVLASAFGAVILAGVVVALVASGVSERRVWKQWLILAAIAALAYAWIAPALPPSVIAAIRMNSPRIGGDFRFTSRSAAGLAILAAGFALGWFATRKARPYLRFFLLFAWLMSGIVVLGYRNINVVPQPHRYQIAMDMGIWLAVVGWADLLACGRRPQDESGRGLASNSGSWRIRAGLKACPTGSVLVILFFLAFGVQARHAIHYARRQILSTDFYKTANYRVVRWMDENFHGRRVMIGGSYSFYANDFTDLEQLHGGQEPMVPNPTLPGAVFQIYSGMNAGAREGQVAVLWLKALGAHAVSVPGPDSEEYYKPFANPRKFDGILPALWKSGGDTVYGVPARSGSLAHVMSGADLVRDPPIHGLDTAQAERYVAALDSPSYPLASWRWTSRHSAVIDAPLAAGQVVSVQTTYSPGWRATAGGRPVEIARDGLDFLVLKPACDGPCQIALTFDGGLEWRAACFASLSAMLLVGLVCLRRVFLRKPGDLDGDGRKTHA